MFHLYPKTVEDQLTVINRLEFYYSLGLYEIYYVYKADYPVAMTPFDEVVESCIT